MEEVTIEKVYHIESEPGDSTRYSFLMYYDGHDSFSFMPKNSTFRFPQQLNYWDIKDIEEKDIIKIAEDQNCNPWTVRECIRIAIKTKEELSGNNI